MKTVLYPGSFDPFTNGHLDLVMRASLLFDQVIVAVAVNSGKNPLFSLEERRVQIEEACKNVANVKVVAIKGLLVDSLDQYKVDAILRGLRAFSDFEYELQMALMNRSLKPSCETIFMTPTVNNCFVASSQIKEVARLGGDFRPYVPENVYREMKKKLRGEE